MEEKEEWKPFRNALNKSQRKSFDEMWEIPKLRITVCSNSVQLVPFHPIVISILFHHYKELKECMGQVKGIMRVKVVQGLQNIEDSSPQELRLFDF
jgi:hypothetical protein